MKYFVFAASIVTAFSLINSITPAQAQSAEEIRRICFNKHNLGKYASAATETQRKENEARRQACIRSGGKS